MNFVLQPWQLILVALAHWINHYQQQRLEFQGTQIQVLLELQGKKRLLLSDDQRRRLAVKGKCLGSKALSELITIPVPIDAPTSLSPRINRRPFGPDSVTRIDSTPDWQRSSAPF